MIYEFLEIANANLNDYDVVAQCSKLDDELVPTIPFSAKLVIRLFDYCFLSQSKSSGLIIFDESK